MNRAPWEKRLEDLAHHLNSCAETYFEPDLFRRNVNNFLQTARTVTFIIQKNKESIPSFDEWYKGNVLDAWKNDEIMQWAKDARNTIEKEGDLELNSQLNLSVIFSYLEEEDIHLKYGKDELINAGIKKLIRFAQKNLPTGVTNESSLKIERRWITSKLKQHELLHALSYVYAKIFVCSKNLAIHLGRNISDSIPNQSDACKYLEIGCQIQFIKLRDFKSCRIRTKQIKRITTENIPESIKYNAEKLKNSLGEKTDFDSVVKFHTVMAETTFTQWGNHVPMLFLFNSRWEVVDVISHAPEDQSEKYFFWRSLGSRIQIQDIYCLVYTCEAWQRSMKGFPYKAIKDLPITGESLRVFAFDKSGNQVIVSWPIIRDSVNDRATLGDKLIEYDSVEQMNFCIPAMRSMGIEPKRNAVKKHS